MIVVHVLRRLKEVLQLQSSTRCSEEDEEDVLRVCAIFYAVASWDSRLKVVDASILNKRICREGDVVEVELDSQSVMSERRITGNLRQHLPPNTGVRLVAGSFNQVAPQSDKVNPSYFCP